MPIRAATGSLRGPHRDAVRAGVEPTPQTHPRLFTAEGQRKWKAPPEGVRVELNTSGNGTWIERWQLPKKPGATGQASWVYNYTLEEVRRRAGLKFADNRELGTKLPQIRAQVREDLARGTGEAHQVAMALTLIDKLYLRVGGEEGLEREHFGATTLQKRHVTVTGDTVRLKFEGKSGVDWDVSLSDAVLAKALRAQLSTVKGPKEPVFQRDGVRLRDDDVNAYLEPFGATAKKFRTFHATRLAREELLVHADAPPAERAAWVTRMFEKVAAQLGHTPAVCRDNYVDPMVVEAFLQGRLR